MKKINDNDLSFIIQGSVNDSNSVQKCIQSIKKNFPKSKIILSTWQGSDCSQFIFDKLVLSKDTNLINNFYKNQNIQNNINRQIISSFNGIKAANTKYCVKIRTDMFFYSNNLLLILGNLNKNKCKYFNLNFQIITPYDLSINPNITPFLYHFNDWILAGLTEDIIKIFTIPLMNKNDLNYFKEKKINKNKNKIYSINNWYKNKIHYQVMMHNLLPRFTPEQYIFKFIILKNFNINFSNAFHINNKLMYIHKLFFENCVSCNSSIDIGMKNNKHKYTILTDRTIFYTKSQINNKCFDYNFYYFKFIGLIKLILINLSSSYYLSLRNFYYKFIK